MVTPVTSSPASIARWIGAAPRQRGSSEAWMLRQPCRGNALAGRHRRHGEIEDEVGPQERLIQFEHPIEVEAARHIAGKAGEKEPVGRVSILEDTDGDGRMDKRTSFLEGLVMARAIALVRGGVLVAAPPAYWTAPCGT